MKSYSRFTFSVNDDALMALLSSLPFESFEEIDDTLVGYIPTEECTEENKSSIHEYADMFFSKFSYEIIPDQNWNALWESNFSSVEIDKFCRIRADFHEDLSSQFQYQITINPKMAFGTGHHQTTYMMMKAMADIDFKDKSVFDYGCGTGILAILASMLGASPILALDIEEESYLNTIENASINHVVNVKAMQGTIVLVADKRFDIILANINRNVLLDSCIEIKKSLFLGGILLLSGILKDDVEIIHQTYSDVGFELLTSDQKEDWVCLKFVLY